MDPGEWRYGQDDQDGRPADEQGLPRAGPGPAPNLWADDPTYAWGATDTWTPSVRVSEPPATGIPTSPEWAELRHSAGVDEAAGPPMTDPPMTGPLTAIPARAREPAHLATGSRPPAGASRPPTPRQVTEEHSHRAPRRGRPAGEELPLGQVVGHTAAWYGVPALFYLVWLITIDGERQAAVGRNLMTSLPWLFTAVVLSLIIASLLRLVTIGWRSFTLSFAATVIGAAATTIAHSLSL